MQGDIHSTQRNLDSSSGVLQDRTQVAETASLPSVLMAPRQRPFIFPQTLAYPLPLRNYINLLEVTEFNMLL